MKILAIDDQQLIALSLEKKLRENGFEVKTASTAKMGMQAFTEFKPDLVILDINMPSVNGLEVVRYIRQKRRSDVPILIMSGNNNEGVILESYHLGVNDYMKKPISLNEVLARVQQILGTIESIDYPGRDEPNEVLHKFCVGVVVPCYNEEDRLPTQVFRDFVSKNKGYHFCFVNDGSTDATLDTLERLREGNEASISIVNCKKNGGKAEAVRQGTLELIKENQLDYIGYLDADLSTDLDEFDSLVNTLEHSDYEIVSGSRISRIGANITKQSARQIISKSINLIIQSILGMGFKDTQCGAKIMHKHIAACVLTKKFITKWLFDVEIFIRIRNFYGKERAKQLICEQPIKKWIHADGSKLSMKDSFKIIGQLAKIAVHYRAV